MSDAFTDIVAGSGMGEWPEDGYETIPPYKLLRLQEDLVDHMVAIHPGTELEGVELEVYLAKLQRLYVNDFEQQAVLEPGDKLKLSSSGFIMAIDGEGNFSAHVLEPGIYTTCEVVRPIIMETPVKESILHDPVSMGGQNVLQISACIQVRNVAVGLESDGEDPEELNDESQRFVCVPLDDPDMKVQRKIT